MNGKDYIENQVMTATPYQLHLMVIDGALRFARLAVKATEAENFEQAHFALDKSRDLVTELIGGLDPSQQPEMIEQLKALFVYAYENLNLADVKQEAGYINNAIQVLEIHREAWCELIGKLLPTEAAVTEASETEEKKTVHSAESLKRPHQIETSEQEHQSRSWVT